MFCREQAVQVHRAQERLEAGGARLVFVGNGNRHFAAAFRADLGLRAPVYVDTAREAYRALDLKRDVLGLLRPRTLRNAVRALRAGHRQGLTRGDAFQLGGVLVVRPGGEIAFRHASDAAGDHAPVEAIAEAACASPREGPAPGRAGAAL